MNDFVLPVGAFVSADPAVQPDHEHGLAVRLTVQPVILAGGSGTRLWPLSRERYPKQLIGLTGDESLLEATLHRLDGVFGGAAHAGAARAGETQAASGLIGPASLPMTQAVPLVVCNEELRAQTAERLARTGRPVRMLLEPVARNTAPALSVAALAARAAAADGADPIIVALPAD
ncbi:MAG: sugar phosphate nucleotidyltransferase, partial [Paraburkholderia sp.]